LDFQDTAPLSCWLLLVVVIIVQKMCVGLSFQIRTGVDLSAPTVGRFCGNHLPSPYTSVSNELVIHFKSDWSFAGEGFHIKYEACK